MDTENPPRLLTPRGAPRFWLHRRRATARAPRGKPPQRQRDAGIDEKPSASRREPGHGFAWQSAELARVCEAHPSADLLSPARRRVRLPSDVGARASVERQRRARVAVPVVAVGHREGHRTAGARRQPDDHRAPRRNLPLGARHERFERDARVRARHLEDARAWSRTLLAATAVGSLGVAPVGAALAPPPRPPPRPPASPPGPPPRPAAAAGLGLPVSV